MFMLYANILDAVVTLDGANELTQARHSNGELFEYPFLHFSEVNPLATASFRGSSQNGRYRGSSRRSERPRRFPIPAWRSLLQID